eukprot:NODE_659_length_5444_cov_0.092423.p5 type:complete len:132 gc:universal NODE_659_length_5444_cov_0.092423:3914-4309(+)
MIPAPYIHSEMETRHLNRISWLPHCSMPHLRWRPHDKECSTLLVLKYQFVKLFSGIDHFLVHFPAFLRSGNNKLLNLFKLMYSENAPRVFSVCTCFLSKTSRIACILNGQNARFYPLIHVESTNRLFACGY